MVERARESAQNQTIQADMIIWSHEDSLAQARNKGMQACQTEYVVFLDADDELDYLYIESMLNADGDICRPSTLGVVDGVADDAPVMIPRRPLYDGNYIVIGSKVNVKLALDVGGFRELPILEDWDLWIRMKLAGADIVDVPEAIYRVNVYPNSRNTSGKHGAVYSEIRNLYSPFAKII